MHLSDADATASYEHPASWKNGRRFQSHGESPGAAQFAADDLAAYIQAIRPAAAASALVSQYGPTRALTVAEAMKAQQPEHSDSAVFWDQVARGIERGIVEARGRQ